MSASSLSSFLSSETTSPRSEKLYSLLTPETTIPIHSQGFNLVLGRDLRQNVRFACRMAVELAEQGKQVFYLNTYAGEHLLRDAFSSVAATPSCFSRIGLQQQPTGDWNPAELRNGLAESAAQVLIVNSFEFGAFTRARRETMARDLIKLQQELRITVIIFSHELKADLSPGCAARGAIGMLSPFAHSVSRLSDRWETVSSVRPVNQPVIEDVHEKQTQNARADRQPIAPRSKPAEILKSPIPGHRRPDPVGQLVPA